MDSKQLCLQLLNAESETEVESIIASHPDLSNESNWYPLDERETNFNMVTNQASTGGKALTELCTNMVDAILMKYARLKGISLTGPEAPQSVIAGVRDLIQLRGARNGILAEVDDHRYLREFAEENLVIGVTGGTRRNSALCFTFVDNGEGQDPGNFEDTFLSLSKGNKSNIPFVQGKYNMGSSGVLSYCGRRWYKLIVSRRYDGNGPWGWTLVRRRPGRGMPVAEYFRAANSISILESETLYPLKLQSGEPDDKVKLTTGTVVKLYNYYMGSATSFRNIRESLNENLVSTVLPFRLMDYRYSPDRSRGGRRGQGVDERPVNGMEFLLLRRDGDEEFTPDAEEQGYEPGSQQHIGDIDHPDLGHISVRCIVLGKQLPGWLRSPRNSYRVFHAVNGQVQFKQNRAYVSSSCRLPGLKDRVVVIVDASDLSEAAHNDVWKGDRENIRETEVGQLYKNEVTNLIQGSDYLKELQHRIAREETENLVEESQVSLFQGLIDADPSIAQLLPGGALVTLPGHIGRGSRDPVDFEGEYSPTFLDLVSRAIRENGAEIAFDGRRVVVFRTDAANGYLDRPDNKGRIITIGGLRDRFSYTSSLINGRLTITFTALPDMVSPGDEIAFTVGLLDDAMPEPVTVDMVLLAVAERRISSGGGGGGGNGTGDDGEGESGEQEESQEGRALPPTRWLTRDGRPIGDLATDHWPSDFTDQDGGLVNELGDGQKLYLFNYDNAHFRRFLDGERNDLNKKVVTEQFRIGMLVLMMGLEDAYARMESTELKTALEERIDEIRRLAAQGASTVVMSIARTLHTIINPAALEDPDDD